MSFFKDVLPLLFSVAVVVGVLYLSYRFSKYLAQKANQVSGGGYIQVKERTMLTQDKGLAVLCVGGKHCLIGFSNQEISVLMELPDYEPAPPIVSGQNFTELFQKAIKGKFGLGTGDHKDAE